MSHSTHKSTCASMIWCIGMQLPLHTLRFTSKLHNRSISTGTAIVFGATGSRLCPVAALLDFLGKRGGSPGPMFINANMTSMQRRQFVSKVQEALTLAGVSGANFNSHSFRVGAATSASQAGILETTVKILGQWRSMAYQHYIRPSPPELAALSSQLTKSMHKIMLPLPTGCLLFISYYA